jgi:hypothetical protein
MNRIADALELLTAQHDEIERLIAVVTTSGSPDTRRRARTDLAELLPLHLALEQELFYPTLASVISHDVLRELVAEHTEIRRILADMVEPAPDDDTTARELSTLHELFEVHRAWQEAYLFQTVAEVRDRMELALLADAMHAWVARMTAAGSSPESVRGRRSAAHSCAR